MTAPLAAAPTTGRPRPTAVALAAVLAAGWLASPAAHAQAQGQAPQAPREAQAAQGMAAGAAPPAAAASGPATSLVLRPSGGLQPAPATQGADNRPLILQADRVRVRPERDAEAEGAVELRRAGTRIRADRLQYDNASDTVTGSGRVRIDRLGTHYSGSRLELQLQRFEGFFLAPEFTIDALNAGGRAERIDFLGSERSRAQAAIYTSCPRESTAGADAGPGVEPDWVLSTRSVTLDTATDEGVAEGAVLKFLGVPILAAPVLSFPLSDARKSGWLPPTVGLDSRSGFTLGVPYYWNIAPNRDATITPILLTRRGLAFDTEARYLEPRHEGRLRLHLLPSDSSFGSHRHAWEVDSSGWLGGSTRYQARMLRVSDDSYWKDFPSLVPATSPRLLAQDAQLQREFATRFGPVTAYAELAAWQVLQTGTGSDRITAPYQRVPRLGLRAQPQLPLGLQAQVETEFNRFLRTPGTEDPADGATDPAWPLARAGWRWHALGRFSRPFGSADAWVTPRITLNLASYRWDDRNGRKHSDSRVIPTTSIDAGLVLERSTALFGRAQRQTLEPRLLYVNTPFRDQRALPNFDAGERDFNAVSIYAENGFAGIDRVSDAHQITAGFTTRLVDAETGAETLRLGLAQRFRLRDQRVVLAGETLTRRVTDLLLEGSTSVWRPWKLDAALQYNPDSQRLARSILAARYNPGPFQTVSAGYRLARDAGGQVASEQVELGWQWPVFRGRARPVGASGGCGGTLYAVGRLNYSLRDSRMTDSLVGFELDTGCWIGRIVSERLSTGRAEATTRLMVQLELVGLSRIGSNPLQALKDNIPGYQLLRESRTDARNGTTGLFSGPEP